MKSPPEKESAQAFIRSQWKIIQFNKSRFFIPNAVIRSIDQFVETREKAISNGMLSSDFDWSKDLFMAKIEHKYFLDWMEKVDYEHRAYIDHWKTVCTNGISSGEKLSLAGINTIYLVHGAVAVGALNALANKLAAPGPSIASAAKLAMPSALIGIALVAIGQIILARFGTEMATRVSGKLVGTVTLHRARSFPRYWEKYRNKYLRLGDIFIYTSVCWFFIYALICYFIILNQ